MLGKALPLKCELGVVRDRDGELSAPFTKASTQRRPVMQLSVAQKQGNENIGRFERDRSSERARLVNSQFQCCVIRAVIEDSLESQKGHSVHY